MTSDSRGTIILRRIRVESVIGILAEEKVEPQQLLVSLVLHADFSRVQESDRIEDSIDYAEVVRATRAFATGNPSEMIEHFAHHVALHLKSEFGCAAVEVTVEKPRYAQDLGLEEIAVRVVR